MEQYLRAVFLAPHRLHRLLEGRELLFRYVWNEIGQRAGSTAFVPEKLYLLQHLVQPFFRHERSQLYQHFDAILSIIDISHQFQHLLRHLCLQLVREIGHQFCEEPYLGEAVMHVTCFLQGIAKKGFRKVRNQGCQRLRPVSFLANQPHKLQYAVMLILRAIRGQSCQRHGTVFVLFNLLREIQGSLKLCSRARERWGQFSQHSCSVGFISNSRYDFQDLPEQFFGETRSQFNQYIETIILIFDRCRRIQCLLKNFCTQRFLYIWRQTHEFSRPRRQVGD